MTVATLALAFELDNDGLGACNGRSLPTFRVCVGELEPLYKPVDESAELS